MREGRPKNTHGQSHMRSTNHSMNKTPQRIEQNTRANDTRDHNAPQASDEDKRPKPHMKAENVRTGKNRYNSTSGMGCKTLLTTAPHRTAMQTTVHTQLRIHSTDVDVTRPN
mmetsp:Transcript_19694/g.78401  ORF Transcript_19694/g.78401 Transcript_19694/m.78401 type:complete len:112 (+) Transcript_19694:322-657(+)